MKFLDVCSQISLVYTVYHASQDETERLLGTDSLTASLEQSAIVHMALEQISNCFKALGWEFLTWKSWVPLAFSPVLVGAVNTYAPIESSEWQERISYLSFNMGNVGRVLVAVATVGLSVLGRNDYVVVALGTYGVCHIKNQDETPDEIKKAIHFSAYVLSITSGLYQSESYLGRFFSTLQLLGFAEHYFAPYLYGQYEEIDFRDTSEMDYEEFLTINPDEFVINPAHLKQKQALYGTVPASYKAFEAELDLLVQAFETVDWGSHADLILLKLSVDDQWTDPQYVRSDVRALYQDYLAERCTKEDIAPYAVAYFKEGVRILAQRLKKRAAEFAELHVSLPELELQVRCSYSIDIGSVSREGFENMQRIISPVTEIVAWNPDSEKSIGTLIQLGIDGANFCGTRLYDLFDLVGKELFEKDLDAEAIAKTIMREKQMTFIYDLMEEETAKYPEFWRRIIGEHTPHRKNLYLKFYGEPIGLDVNPTENDETTPNYNAGDRLFWLWWVRRAKRRFYEEYYTTQHLSTWIREQTVSRQRLSWEKMDAWFEKQSLESAKVCDSQSGEYKEEALRFFLTKLGALSPRA